MSESSIQITLRQQQDYRFEVDFGDGIAVLQADEPAPLGSGQGPSPVQLLAAAVGNCLSDSLLFACANSSRHPSRCTAPSRPKWAATQKSACAC